MRAYLDKPGMRFNLIIEGTGVRFERRKKTRGFKLRHLALSMLLVPVSAVAVWLYFWPVSFQSTAPAEEKAGDVSEEALPSSLEDAVNNPEHATRIEETHDRTFVRFGIFLSRDNADRMVKDLQKHNIFADVRVASRTTPSFTIKAGLLEEGKLADLRGELQKISVALSPRIEQQYVLVGPIWSKDNALAVAGKMRDLGIETTEEVENPPGEMFEVVSMPLDNETVAMYKMAEWREKGYEGVVEK